MNSDTERGVQSSTVMVTAKALSQKLDATWKGERKRFNTSYRASYAHDLTTISSGGGRFAIFGLTMYLFLLLAAYKKLWREKFRSRAIHISHALYLMDSSPGDIWHGAKCCFIGITIRHHFMHSIEYRKSEPSRIIIVGHIQMPYAIEKM